MGDYREKTFIFFPANFLSDVAKKIFVSTNEGKQELPVVVQVLQKTQRNLVF